MAFSFGAISLAMATGAMMSAPFAVTPWGSIVPTGRRTVLIFPGTNSRNSIQLIRSISLVLGASCSAPEALTATRQPRKNIQGNGDRLKTREASRATFMSPIFSQRPDAATSEISTGWTGTSALLFALRFYFSVERRHADAEHACGLFPRSAAMIQRGVDISAFLLLNEFVQTLAHWHRGNGLFGFLACRGGHDLRRKIGWQDHVFLAQGASALDRVLELADVPRIVVVAKNIDRFGIDLLRFSPGRTRLLLQKMVHQERHVFQALPEGGNFNRDNGEPVIKILPK